MQLEENGMPGWLLPDKVYDVLKWAGLIACPAVASLVLGLGETWGLDNAQQVAMTVTLAGTCIGALIGASEAKAWIGGGHDGD